MQDGMKTVSLPQRRADVLCKNIGSLSAGRNILAVLLHFSGYGYQERGVPSWLLRGLQMWKNSRAGIPLLTAFHELYATGVPWQSSFWLCPVQKWIAYSVLKLSSGVLAPTEVYTNVLQNWSGCRDVEITRLPVFSNVGEPGCGPAPSIREPIAVAFGLNGVEDRLFGTYRRQVERVLIQLGIRRVVDVGPRLSPLPRKLAGIPLISKGVLPEIAVSEVLRLARFGLIAYPLHVICKSGVFAAYAAHGIVPIVFSDRRGQFDGLQAGQHFLDGLRLEGAIGIHDLAGIQRQLFKWYEDHSAQAHARCLERMIGNIAGVIR
jgi:hypothetical protein